MGLTCLERINKIIAHEPAGLSGEPLKKHKEERDKIRLARDKLGHDYGFQVK